MATPQSDMYYHLHEARKISKIFEIVPAARIYNLILYGT